MPKTRFVFLSDTVYGHIFLAGLGLSGLLLLSISTLVYFEPLFFLKLLGRWEWYYLTLCLLSFLPLVVAVVVCEISYRCYLSRFFNS